MIPISSLISGQAYNFLILSTDIVGSSKLTDDDSEATVKSTKEHLFLHFKSIVSRFPNVEQVSGDGFYFLFPIAAPKQDFDFATQLAIDLLKNLELFNANSISGNLLSRDIRIRMTAHYGSLIYDSTPGLISGGPIDMLLKNERLIGRPNCLSVTKAVYGSLSSQSLRRQFELRVGTLDPSIAHLVSIYDYPRHDSQQTAAATPSILADLEKLRITVGAAIKALAIWDLRLREQMNPPADERAANSLVKELKQIQDQFEHDYEDVWITDAKRTIRYEIERLEFDYDKKEAYAFDESGHGFTTFRGLEKLRDYLIDKSNESFYGSVPFDGGAAVWEDDSEDWVQEIIDEYTKTWEALGWPDE